MIQNPIQSSENGDVVYAPQPLEITNIEISDNQRNDFQKKIMSWIKELSMDISSSGYIGQEPKSLCAKKTKELTEFTMSKSAQISTIRMNNNLKKTSFWHFVRRVIFFFLESCFPLSVSLLAIYLIYTRYTTNTYTEVEIPVYLPENYIHEPLYKQLYLYSYARMSQISTFQDLGTMIGSSIGSVINGLSGFILSTLNSTFSISIQGVFIKIYYGILSISIGVLLYLSTKPCTSLFSNSRQLIEKRETLSIIEDQFIQEMNKMIEQCIFTLLQTNISNTFEHFLTLSSKTANKENQIKLSHLIYTYQHDYEVLYILIMGHYEQHIRKMELNEILHLSKTNTHFTNLMYRLIREANDDVAEQIMILNRTLIEIPDSMRNACLKPFEQIGNMIETYRPAVHQLLLQNI
jgi:hypothetical protein